MKYTVVYDRGIRIAPYEPLKIGLYMEFDDKDTDIKAAFDIIAFMVDTQLEEAYERLRAK